MSILNRKAVRDLWEAKGQFISVLIVVIIGVMFYSGINSTFRNLSEASSNYYRDYRFGDLWANLYKAPESIVGKVKDLPFVNEVSGRVVQDVNIGMDGENAVIRLITLPDEKQEVVNDIVLTGGRYFSAAESNQCLVLESFMQAHGLKLGDTIAPIINGNEVKLKIVGTVISPEYVYAVKDASELVADNKKFGVVYVKQSFGQTVLGFTGSVNSISVTLQQGTDAEQAKDKISKLLDEYGLKGVVDRDSQLSYKVVSEKIKGYQSIGLVFPVIFFVVAAVIVYITMGRMVENQRPQIGVLKAFGFSDFQVLMHYLSYSAFVAVAGSIIGSVLGVFMAKGFTDLVNIYFKFPNTVMKMYPDLVLPSSAMTLFFCLLAGYNSCKQVLKIMPSEAMRPKAPLVGKKILLEKVSFLWRNLSFQWKMILRNLARYKRRTLLSSIGVILATAITIFALGEKNSIDFLIDEQYTNIQNYDLKVNFTKFQSLEEIRRLQSLPHIVKLEPVVETGVEITNGWRKKEVGFTALVNTPEMYKVTDQQGRAVALPSKGILIPEKLAKALAVKPGDTVYLKSYLPGKEQKPMQVKAIIAQYLGTSAYSSLDSVKYLLGEGSVANSVVLRLDSPKSQHLVTELLKEMDTVGSVQSKSDALNNLQQNMASMTSVIGVMILLASVLSIAVIYNIATINIFERQRELATLKVLGFKDSELRSLIFNENYLITIFGIIIGLPFGNWLGIATLASYETEAYTIPFIIGPRVYLMAAAFTLCFTLLANLTLIKKIRNIDMVSVLKSNE